MLLVRRFNCSSSNWLQNKAVARYTNSAFSLRWFIFFIFSKWLSTFCTLLCFTNHFALDSCFFFIFFYKFLFSIEKYSLKEFPLGRGDIFLIVIISIWSGWEILLIILLLTSVSMLGIFLFGFVFFNWKVNKELPLGPILNLYTILIATPKLLLLD